MDAWCCSSCGCRLCWRPQRTRLRAHPAGADAGSIFHDQSANLGAGESPGSGVRDLWHGSVARGGRYPGDRTEGGRAGLGSSGEDRSHRSTAQHGLLLSGAGCGSGGQIRGRTSRVAFSHANFPFRSRAISARLRFVPPIADRTQRRNLAKLAHVASRRVFVVGR